MYQPQPNFKQNKTKSQKNMVPIHLYRVQYLGINLVFSNTLKKETKSVKRKNLS